MRHEKCAELRIRLQSFFFGLAFGLSESDTTKEPS